MEMAALSVARINQYLSGAFGGRARTALNALFTDMATTPVSIAVATFTVLPEHANRILTLDRAAGSAVLLPPATGTGAKFDFYLSVDLTGNVTIDTVGSDIMQGAAIFETDNASDGVTAYPTTSSTDTLTMFTASGGTTGGKVGAQVQLRDVAAGVYSVLYVSSASGTEVTPFS